MTSDSAPSLADRLRSTLVAARANAEIRIRLAQLVNDPARMDPILTELGPRHAVVRELFRLARHASDRGPTALAS